MDIRAPHSIAEISAYLEQHPNLACFSEEVTKKTGSLKASVIYMAIAVRFYRLWKKNKKQILDDDGWFHIPNEEICPDANIQPYHLSRYTNILANHNLLERKIVSRGRGRGKKAYYRIPIESK